MVGRDVVMIVISIAATNAAAQREVMMTEVCRRLRLGLATFGDVSSFEVELLRTACSFSRAILDGIRCSRDYSSCFYRLLIRLS